MNVKIRKKYVENLSYFGWEYLRTEKLGDELYSKKVNDIDVVIKVHKDKSNPRAYVCFEAVFDFPNPDDLIAVGNELKKLEEN